MLTTTAHGMHAEGASEVTSGSLSKPPANSFLSKGNNTMSSLSILAELQHQLRDPISIIADYVGGDVDRWKGVYNEVMAEVEHSYFAMWEDFEEMEHYEVFDEYDWGDLSRQEKMIMVDHFEEDPDAFVDYSFCSFYFRLTAEWKDWSYLTRNQLRRQVKVRTPHVFKKFDAVMEQLRDKLQDRRGKCERKTSYRWICEFNSKQYLKHRQPCSCYWGDHDSNCLVKRRRYTWS